ncbi:MAG: glycosyltransferase family 4 protein, partial [FCB group bacterium]|nr:glycosyltransferase family 4 protein [FCB group bacterium]
CDVILGTSPQFFTALAAKRLSRIKKKPWIMEVRDIWPESIKAVNAVSNRRALGYLEKKERECYAAARGVVCVTQGIYNNLLKKGVPENKLRLFTNGANTERFSPRGKDTGLLERLNLNGKKVIGYLGTMGMSHKLDFILNSMKKINDPDIHFLLIGEGAEKEKLVRLKNKLQLKNVTILNGISKQEAPAYLSLMDVALVHLRKTELFQGALPSKIFENAAMGKPLLLGLQGEAERLIAAYPAGLAFEPENEADFLEKMHILLSEREFYDRCVAGAMKLAKDFDRSRIARDMLTCIREWSKQ